MKLLHTAGQEKIPLDSFGPMFAALGFFLLVLFEVLKYETTSSFLLILKIVIIIPTLALSLIVLSMAKTDRSHPQTEWMMNLIIMVVGAITFFFAWEIMISIVPRLYPLVEAVVQFGAAWLIVIPAILLPVIVTAYAYKYFQSLSQRRQQVYSIITLSLAGLVYFTITEPSSRFHVHYLNLMRLLTQLPDFLTVFGIGLFLGVVGSILGVSLYVAGTKLFNDLLDSIIYWIRKK
jgi:hypothetical protein